MRQSIGQVVKRLRAKRGLSQKQVEIQTYGKIGASWLASLETDKIQFSEPNKIETLAAVLGTTAFAIYTEAGVITPPNPAGNDPDELAIIESFRKLSSPMKTVALNMLHQLATADSVTTEQPAAAPLETQTPIEKAA
jgi:transcriptional regulator with XRE-family HTH domain